MEGPYGDHLQFHCGARCDPCGVSGYVEPGHMLAIMGPSGCGKSTMLDCLAGRTPRSLVLTGSLLLNGHVSKMSHGVSAYVTQDELLTGTLTVYETLLYTALLRLPAAMSREDKVQRVESVIVDMGLSRARGTKIGSAAHTGFHEGLRAWGLLEFYKGVSGGQKRRVAIASELIMHPTLLFLDEPTSGLDSAAAFHVMAAVRSLAEKGRTIVTVIHQPASEVYELFDQLCLLSKGSVIYFGAAAAADAAFSAAGLPCPSNRNPADHFLHCINADFKSEASDKATAADGKHGDVDSNVSALISQYERTTKTRVLANVARLAAPGVKYVIDTENTPSSVTQAMVLSQRTLVNNYRNIGLYGLRLAMFVMLCLCIGTIYLKLGNSWLDSYSRTALLFFIVAFLTFMERQNNYYEVSTFVISNTVASAPFIFIISIASSLVVYWLVGLNYSGDRFVFFFINLFMALMTVESLMMAIAAVVPHYLMGIAEAVLRIMGMYMLVCDATSSRCHSCLDQTSLELPGPVWTYPMHYVGYHTYAWAGFMQNEFNDPSVSWGCPCEATPSGCGAQYTIDAPCQMSGQDILAYWSVLGVNKWVDVGIQAGMIVIYRLFFWGAIKFSE
ncbi:MAG: hypothetical protein WDW38_008940 [Sanguina aurantia]